MYCRKCGKEIDNSYAHCPYCGAETHPSTKEVTSNKDLSNVTNRFCIAGFVVSFFFGELGLAFSIIGLCQVKKNGAKGKGLAVAGIIISCISVVVSIVISIVLNLL